MTILFDSVRPVKSVGFGFGILAAAVPCCSAEVAPCKACFEVYPAPDVFIPGELVDPDDAESDPELWPDGWDEHIWNIGPDPSAGEPDVPTAEDEADYREWSQESDARQHLDHSERLTLDELCYRQAAFYRGWSNAAGDMLADAMAELALKVRMTDATTPADFAARKDILDREARDQWESVGFENGKASCPCHDYDHAATAGGYGHSA